MAQGIRKLASAGTLTEQVREALRQAIVEGELTPGTVYSVGSLADQLGVSRTPVREAVLQLARIGLMEVLKNQGVRVLEPSQEDFIHIMQLRLWLEVPATRLATTMAGDADRRAVKEAHERLVLASESGDSTESVALDRRFHRRLLEITGNTRMVEWIQDLRDLVVARGQIRASDAAWIKTVAHEHDPIVEAFLAGDAEGAAEAMRAHLSSTLSGVISGLHLNEDLAG